MGKCGYRIQPWPWATDSLVLFEASLWAPVGLVSLRGPVFLGSKPPEVMLSVECSLSDAAIACASWCGSWYVGFVAIFLLICRSFYWRVYDFSDVFRVSQSVVWCGKKKCLTGPRTDLRWSCYVWLKFRKLWRSFLWGALIRQFVKWHRQCVRVSLHFASHIRDCWYFCVDLILEVELFPFPVIIG